MIPKPLGFELHKLQKSWMMKAYYFVFGTPDLHSHIRYRAIKRYFQHAKTIDVGAGIGLISLAFRRLCRKPLVILTYTEEEERLAKKLAMGLSDVKVVRQDARNLSLNEKFEQCLLIDVLEHIPEDDLVLRNVNRILEIGGFLLISVPTPLYPVYFGYKFAKDVGHVRDGYTLDDIERKLYLNGFKVLSWRYHTNPFTAHLLYYVKLEKFPKLRALLMPILKLFSYLDELSPLKSKRELLRSCGIALLAKKVAEICENFEDESSIESICGKINNLELTFRA